jgi:hypothetical protein
MTGAWLIAALVAVFLILTVVDLLISFDSRSYLAGAMAAVQPDPTPSDEWPTDEYEAVAEFCGERDYDNACVLCGRYLPDDKLEYVTSRSSELWCVDLASCKAWRDEWMSEGVSK